MTGDPRTVVCPRCQGTGRCDSGHPGCCWLCDGYEKVTPQAAEEYLRPEPTP